MGKKREKHGKIEKSMGRGKTMERGKIIKSEKKHEKLGKRT